MGLCRVIYNVGRCVLSLVLGTIADTKNFKKIDFCYRFDGRRFGMLPDKFYAALVELFGSFRFSEEWIFLQFSVL